MRERKRTSEKALFDFVVRSRPGNAKQGQIIAPGGIVFRCAIGKGGISGFKREGDGATPLARMRALRVLFRDRPQVPLRTRLPARRTGSRDGWCDASGDRNYNRPVGLPYSASAERMRRDDHLYDMVVVLDWNIRPRRRGAGSAIFLHIARPGFAPTEGCVAVEPRVMQRLLPLLGRGAAIRVLR